MQAIKLTLEGKFWDSHIYSGRLYLFDRQGAIHNIDWDSFVESCPLPPELQLGMQCAFGRSDYFYGTHWTPMFRDPEVRPLIQSKFERLSKHTLQYTEKEWRQHVTYTQNSPFPFPHTDARIYSKTMYVSSDAGVAHSNCGTKSIRGVSRRVTTDWDCPVLSIATYSNTLAFAAGEEGLFEKRIGDTWWQYSEEVEDEVRLVVRAPCSMCEWAFYSIFGAAHGSSGYLAAFDIDREQQQTTKLPPRQLLDLDEELHTEGEMPTRSFEEVISAVDIFGNQGFSWANRDKLYQVGPSDIRVVRYRPWNEEPKDRFATLPSIPLPPLSGDVVSAGVAVFGTVIECDFCLAVILSDGTTHTIPGEPVRWRVFPRSKHYDNQLHIIYEDRMDILSFNHDYFVDQTTKASGLEHWE